MRKKILFHLLVGIVPTLIMTLPWPHEIFHWLAATLMGYPASINPNWMSVTVTGMYWTIGIGNIPVLEIPRYPIHIIIMAGAPYFLIPLCFFISCVLYKLDKKDRVAWGFGIYQNLYTIIILLYFWVFVPGILDFEHIKTALAWL